MTKEQRAEYERLKQLVDGGLSFASLDFTPSTGGEEETRESRIFSDAGILRRNILDEQSNKEASLATLNQTLSSTERALSELRIQESSLQQTINTAPSQLSSLREQTASIESSVVQSQTSFDNAEREYDNAVTARNSIDRNSFYYNTYRTESYQVTVRIPRTRTEEEFKDCSQRINHHEAGGHIHWHVFGRGSDGWSTWNKSIYYLNQTPEAKNHFRHLAASREGCPLESIVEGSVNYLSKGGTKYSHPIRGIRDAFIRDCIFHSEIHNCGPGRSKFAYNFYTIKYQKKLTEVIHYEEEQVQTRSRGVYAGQAFNQSSYDSAISAADRQVSTKLEAKNDAQSSLRTAQSALEAHRQAIRDLDSDLGRAPGNLASVQQQIREAETRGVELGQRIAEIEAQIEEGVLDLDRLESLCAEINNSVWGELLNQIGEFNQIFHVQQELFGHVENGDISQIERLTEAIEYLGENIRNYCHLSEEMYQKLLSYLHEKFIKFVSTLAEEARSELIAKLYGSEVMKELVDIIEELGYDQQIATERAFSGNNQALLQHLATGENNEELLIKIVKNGNLELAQELVNCGADIRAAYDLAVNHGDRQTQLRLCAISPELNTEESSFKPQGNIDDIAQQMNDLGFDVQGAGLFGADSLFADGIALS